MTYFETIKQKLNNGYIIVRTVNLRSWSDKRPVIIYQIRKQESNNTWITYCYVSFNIVKILVKEMGAKVSREAKENVCLNFIPQSVPHNHVVIFHD